MVSASSDSDTLHTVWLWWGFCSWNKKETTEWRQGLSFLWLTTYSVLVTHCSKRKVENWNVMLMLTWTETDSFHGICHAAFKGHRWSACQFCVSSTSGNYPCRSIRMPSGAAWSWAAASSSVSLFLGLQESWDSWIFEKLAVGSSLLPGGSLFWSKSLGCDIA